MNLGELFNLVPRNPWGLRGDPVLWEMMAERLSRTTAATHDEAYLALLDAFHEITGLDPYVDVEEAYVPSCDSGYGMSRGVVCVPVWRDRLLPLLVKRWDRADKAARTAGYDPSVPGGESPPGVAAPPGRSTETAAERLDRFMAMSDEELFEEQLHEGGGG